MRGGWAAAVGAVLTVYVRRGRRTVGWQHS